MKTIDDIIKNALCFIELLHCDNCNKKVDFTVVDRVTAHCLKCDSVLTVNYKDLKPVGLLGKRAPIQRLSNRLG